MYYHINSKMTEYSNILQYKTKLRYTENKIQLSRTNYHLSPYIIVGKTLQHITDQQKGNVTVMILMLCKSPSEVLDRTVTDMTL